MKMKVLAAAAGLCLTLTAPAQAITFNFYWSGDASADTTLLSSDDNTARATGTITIDKSAGETFTLSDISSTSIQVTGDTFTDFSFNSWFSAGGVIAGDGLSATFSATGNPYSRTGFEYFGCSRAGCIASPDDGSHSISIRDLWATTVVFRYDSQTAALASMRMAALAPIPVPASLPLLAFGLGGLGLMARRKRKVS